MVVPYPPEYAGPNRCVLRQDAVGQSVTCETSMPGLRTAIHARPGYVSPEQFILLQVAPGQSVTWTRSYEFATGKINK